MTVLQPDEEVKDVNVQENEVSQEVNETEQAAQAEQPEQNAQESVDMGQALQDTMTEKNEAPENDKKQLMQTIYDGNMKAVQDGITNDVMSKGTLDEKRAFFENVASANL